MRTTRRGFLVGAGTTAGLAAAATLGLTEPAAAAPTTTRRAGARAAAEPPIWPFTLGVASGDPLPDGVVLWTRLAPRPLIGGGMPAIPFAVDWQVAADEHFRSVVRSGTAIAHPALAHSVHVDVRGLRPAADYFYRFRIGQFISPVGRTRTAPDPAADPDRLTFAVVNCQDWQNGYWPAFTALAAENLDLVVHLGDYIYEYDPAPGSVRLHTTPETLGLDQLSTLADYRNRHAQYKCDPALQAAHAAAPWVAVWDDHEVENNYAGLVDEVDDTGARHQDPAAFAAQRAAAYQAYYEHLPLRAAYVPGSPTYQLYRRFDFGRLLRLSLLDTRQYRTDQPCGLPSDFGPGICGGLDATSTLTGATQENWLYDGLSSSPARWNVIGQQVMMARTLFVNPSLLLGQDTPEPLRTLANLDQWDGYVAFRSRVLRQLASGVRNPVVLAGDIHSTWVNDLRVDFDRPETPVVAAEFVATSVSSAFPSALVPVVRISNATLNPQVRYFDGTRHGYHLHTVTRGEWRADIRTVASITTPTSPVSTTASYVVHDGVPGAVAV